MMDGGGIRSEADLDLQNFRDGMRQLERLVQPRGRAHWPCRSSDVQ
jgi:hypothetical protein